MRSDTGSDAFVVNTTCTRSFDSDWGIIRHPLSCPLRAWVSWGSHSQGPALGCPIPLLQSGTAYGARPAIPRDPTPPPYL